MKTFCCEQCRREAGELRTTMIVCPTCGNKRCPKADHHENKCTGSNEPGQVGVNPSDTTNERQDLDLDRLIVGASDARTYRAISVKLAAFLCREKWSDELPEKTREEMQRLVKEWQDVDRDHKPSDTTKCLACECWSARYKRQADELAAVKRDANDAGRCLQECCDNESEIEKIATTVLGAEYVAGDSYGVPGAVECAAEMAKQITALKARLAEVESQSSSAIATVIESLKAAERRVKEIQAAWNRVAGFAVSESCGPENRFRITIDYPTLEKLQDAYRAMHDITTALSTTPPADGAQSS